MSSTTRKIEDLTSPPKIGERYWTPCLLPVDQDYIKQVYGDIPSIEWLLSPRPLLLSIHTDPELGQPLNHAHFDYRFCSDRQLQQARLYTEKAIGSPMSDADLLTYVNLVSPSVDDVDLFEVRWLKRKCYRNLPDYKAPPLLPTHQKFLRQFVGHPLECGRCPHRGLPVMSLQRCQDQPRRVICPGHGLTIDVHQQRVVDSPVQSASKNRFLNVFNLHWLIYTQPPQLEFQEISEVFAQFLESLDPDFDLEELYAYLEDSSY